MEFSEHIILTLLCLNGLVWSGSVAAGVARYLRHRDLARQRHLEDVVEDYRQRFRGVVQSRIEERRLQAMRQEQREKHREAVELVRLIFSVHDYERTMSLTAAQRHGMTRPQWERARLILRQAGVIDLDGNGSARLTRPAPEARETVMAYLDEQSRNDAPTYVYP